jgi:hypothetical protein
VEVAFRRIPREVLEKKAVEQGDIKFFELRAFSVEAKRCAFPHRPRFFADGAPLPKSTQ